MNAWVAAVCFASAGAFCVLLLVSICKLAGFFLKLFKGIRSTDTQLVVAKTIEEEEKT